MRTTPFRDKKPATTRRPETQAGPEIAGKGRHAEADSHAGCHAGRRAYRDADISETDRGGAPQVAAERHNRG
jgi:hypothetical protein